MCGDDGVFEPEQNNNAGNEANHRGRTSRIPVDHVLRQFFRALVEEKLCSSAGLQDRDICSYVANLLSDFCEGEQLCRIRDAAGRPLADVGEMLLESDPVYGRLLSFDREREVRKHIGDYTLFFAGMFPESINHYRLRRQRLENFIDFVKAGKESYYIVSQFDIFEYSGQGALFKKLSEAFENCVYGLNMVKNALAEMQHPLVRRTPELIM